MPLLAGQYPQSPLRMELKCVGLWLSWCMSHISLKMRQLVRNCRYFGSKSKDWNAAHLGVERKNCLQMCALPAADRVNDTERRELCTCRKKANPCQGAGEDLFRRAWAGLLPGAAIRLEERTLRADGSS